MQFIAREDFWSDETQSQYVKGLNYTATTDELQALAAQWMRQGKIERIAPTARINGRE